jgi:hypothetical protein
METPTQEDYELSISVQSTNTPEIQSKNSQKEECLKKGSRLTLLKGESQREEQEPSTLAERRRTQTR